MADIHNPGAATSQNQITLLRDIVGRIDQAENRFAFCIVKQLLPRSECVFFLWSACEGAGQLHCGDKIGK